MERRNYEFPAELLDSFVGRQQCCICHNWFINVRAMLQHRERIHNE
jgi:hypothetical protein